MAKEVSDYKENLKKEAEKLLLTTFPTTILALNNVLKAPKFHKRDFKDMQKYLNTTLPDLNCHSDGDSPPRKRVRYSNGLGLVKSNKYVTDIIQSVKPHLIKMVEDLKMLEMWIHILIPKREGGNNFGVAIQEEILLIIQVIGEESAAFYNRISDYYTARAKIMKKILKHPQVEDYKREVVELDESEYFKFCMIMIDIRNRYCELYDVFLKNLEKLKKPRRASPQLVI